MTRAALAYLAAIAAGALAGRAVAWWQTEPFSVQLRISLFVRQVEDWAADVEDRMGGERP